MADGLFSRSDILSVQVAEEINNSKNQNEVKNAESLSNKNVGDKFIRIPDECESRVKKGIGASLESAIPDKEVSVFPVKHLDFSFEDKNLDGSIPYMIQRDSEMTECSILNHKGPSTVNALVDRDELQTIEEVQGEKMESPTHMVSKMEVKSSRQDNNCIISGSPANEVKKSMGNNQCNETATPLSSVALKDQLGLSSWLPLEICKIYKKRGIAELYPWQVYVNICMTPNCFSPSLPFPTT